ncbi:MULTISPECIES: hypothetical protein [unclassified Colwellia]|uniref:hypothetical protein n=1 Tax=unclassified Colwellia TaxID=196834 RepID=UPI0015F62023|nr:MULTISPECIES: hypothetical protein [unclassified Colwellia]MBA6356232.1 hypothetical protein [Colwellia sp. BRX8-3]MBA6359294.1 hypothetical protein [Colwellia sp. BRX8-6]MBA6368055.1 hypothetical protein [Colwellia sp. BRX8-5]MBA6377002.1 hypothetical protein [Colwellia sp. BRX8-2]MBA6383178.1 hypothetical protein [Colwellia sp. BRX10-9]
MQNIDSQGAATNAVANTATTNTTKLAASSKKVAVITGAVEGVRKVMTEALK